MNMGGVCFFEPSGRASGEESTPKFALRGFAFALRLENRAAITTGLQQTRDKSSANTLSSPKRYKVLNGLTGRYGHLIEGGFYLVIYRGRIAKLIRSSPRKLSLPLESKPQPRRRATLPERRQRVSRPIHQLDIMAGDRRAAAQASRAVPLERNTFNHMAATREEASVVKAPPNLNPEKNESSKPCSDFRQLHTPHTHTCDGCSVPLPARSVNHSLSLQRRHPLWLQRSLGVQIVAVVSEF